jgi:glycosyltransferase XagB
LPKGRVKTKPRALNFALGFSSGDIIGVLDAEDAPEKDQLLKVANQFAMADSRLVCLQGRLDFYNAYKNWLTRCFTLKYAA